MRVAVLGTGKMGTAAARRLARQGFATTLWNRTRARAEAVGAGEVRDTAREVAGQAEVVISLLTGPEAVRAVYSELEPCEAKVFLEMSTAGPDVHEELGERFSTLVAAPVIAPPARLEAGGALLLAGGDEALDLALRLLDGPDFPMPIVEAVRQAFAEVLDEHGDKELTAVLERYRR